MIKRNGNCFEGAQIGYFNVANVHTVRPFPSVKIDCVAIYLLEAVMPFIGKLALDRIHDGTLAPYVAHRIGKGRAHKTVNLGLALTRRILNLAARKWRDENGRTWLDTPPMLTMLPLIGFQREPRPITWAEQRRILPLLPDHLGRMVLFDLHTGARDEVVCGLKWEWEVPIPELGVSVFSIPRESVKGRKRDHGKLLRRESPQKSPCK